MDPLFYRAGNRPYFIIEQTIADTKWLFDVILDYGEYDDFSAQVERCWSLELSNGPLLGLPITFRDVF